MKSQYVVCKKLEAVGQRMSQISSERLNSAPPFYHTSLYLFGSFHIRDTVKRRTTCMAYGIIFIRLVTYAIYLDLADSYNTQSFLTAFKKFVSIRGYPHTTHSDSNTHK